MRPGRELPGHRALRDPTLDDARCRRCNGFRSVRAAHQTMAVVGDQENHQDIGRRLLSEVERILDGRIQLKLYRERYLQDLTMSSSMKTFRRRILTISAGVLTSVSVMVDCGAIRTPMVSTLTEAEIESMAKRSMPSLGISGAEPELPRVFINTNYAPPAGRTIAVPAGGDRSGAARRYHYASGRRHLHG